MGNLDKHSVVNFEQFWQLSATIGNYFDHWKMVWGLRKLEESGRTSVYGDITPYHSPSMNRINFRDLDRIRCPINQIQPYSPILENLGYGVKKKKCTENYSIWSDFSNNDNCFSFVIGLLVFGLVCCFANFSRISPLTCLKNTRYLSCSINST